MAPLTSHKLARYQNLLAALIGAIAAGIAVAAIALAADSPGPTATPSITPAGQLPAGKPSPAVLKSALALQGAFVNVVESVSPSVVQIQDQRGLGSGIVLDSSGDIVTNNHVVTGASAYT